MDTQAVPAQSKPGTVYIENGLFSAPRQNHLSPKPIRLTWHKLNAKQPSDDVHSHDECSKVGANTVSGSCVWERFGRKGAENDAFTSPPPHPLSSSSSSSSSSRRSTTKAQHGSPTTPNKQASPAQSIVFEACRGVPATSIKLSEVLPYLDLMTMPDRGNLALTSQIQVMQILVELARQSEFPDNFNRITANRMRIDEDMSTPSSSSHAKNPHVFLTLISDSLVTRRSFGRVSPQNYHSVLTSLDQLVKYKLQVLNFALTLLERHSIFAMGVLFGLQDTITGKVQEGVVSADEGTLPLKNSSLHGRGIGSGNGVGTGSLSRSSSVNPNFTILQKILASWMEDIRYLDGVGPSIHPCSVEENVILCARTASKIFMKITVLIKPCCFTYLCQLGCQHNFANILHRMENDWMHPSLLVDREEVLMGMALAYESVT